MIAVIFEVEPVSERLDEYLGIAAELRELLQNQEGFISIERFQSLADDNKILSLSFWSDEAAIENWRNVMEHRLAQQRGRESLFHCYRIRVAQVMRDYTETERNEAPPDSNSLLSPGNSS